MEDVFKSFCAFGNKGEVAQMDGSKFAKLCRDCKLLDKKLTTTDVDIIFTKSKAKTERKMNYKQFLEALKLIAEKKYPEEEEAAARTEKVQQSILSGHKKIAGTKPVSSAVVDRLTDTKKYTGSHKERFDESGKGKGAAGRKDLNVNAKAGYVSGYANKDTFAKDKTG